jgi:hypothetical protein
VVSPDEKKKKNFSGACFRDFFTYDEVEYIHEVILMFEDNDQQYDF